MPETPLEKLKRLDKDATRFASEGGIRQSFYPVVARELLPLLPAIINLAEAVQRTLDDEESRPGGWGPDVTAVEWLHTALLPFIEKQP